MSTLNKKQELKKEVKKNLDNLAGSFTSNTTGTLKIKNSEKYFTPDENKIEREIKLDYIRHSAELSMITSALPDDKKIQVTRFPDLAGFVKNANDTNDFFAFKVGRNQINPVIAEVAKNNPANPAINSDKIVEEITDAIYPILKN